MPTKLTTEEFIKRLRKTYGDYYDYSKVEYVNNITEVKIICPKLGELFLIPKSLGKPLKDTVKDLKTFISKSNKIHNNKYDYSKTEYINQNKKVVITCPEHGDFTQLPLSHLKGHGCPNCTNNKKYSTEEFVYKAKIVHGDKYNYLKVDYKNNRQNIIITCPEHGDFTQIPSHHLKGHGCPKCGQLKTIEPIKKDTNQFILESKIVHGDKYGYSKVEYKNIKEGVVITCPEHGDFTQTPDSHLRGCGCPKCPSVTSKGESELKDYLKSINIQFNNNDRDTIKPLELDIYIPSHNMAIEYNGLYWHSEIHKSNNYHLNKTEICEDKCIRLIHIFEDEWLHKKDIVKSRIKNILGITTNKIYARKCEIKNVSTKERDLFLINNHIQGTVKSSINLGLYHNGELVSVMTFNKPRLGIGAFFNGYELSRFCNKLDTTVIGGASKLLKYFINNYNPKEIISYADRRWSNGNLYEKLGFDLSRINKPNYSYIINTKRKHRFNFRKKSLKKEGFDISTKTEHQIMLERGIYRIYDCGTITYKKTLY